MPHRKIDTVYAGKELIEAQKVLFLIHGRGATAQSILPLANEIGVSEKYALMAPNAFNNTWYPYSFVAPEAQNQPYLDGALSLIDVLVQEVKNESILAENIHFMGFSQGACLAAEYVARNAQPFGSLHVYSGGLIGHQFDEKKYQGSFNDMPVFIGCSDTDAHIPLQRVHESTALFKKLGASVDERIYPNAPHSVFQDEIDASRAILL
jgi:phospholipase/carboxylesterase